MSATLRLLNVSVSEAKSATERVQRSSFHDLAAPHHIATAAGDVRAACAAVREIVRLAEVLAEQIDDDGTLVRAILDNYVHTMARCNGLAEPCRLYYMPD